MDAFDFCRTVSGRGLATGQDCGINHQGES